MVFFKFYKWYDEFEEMSLDSKCNRMKDFNELLISFKSLKTKQKQKHKEQIMKNIDELYKKYHNAQKSDYDTDDELKEDKKRKFDYKPFELGNEINKESKLDQITKELELTELLEWLSSRNDFNEAKKID